MGLTNYLKKIFPYKVKVKLNLMWYSRDNTKAKLKIEAK